MAKANSAPILSKLVSQYPRVKPGAAIKPKLLDRLREALRSRHSFATHLMEGVYDIRIVQELLGDECHDIVDRFSCQDIVDKRLINVICN